MEFNSRRADARVGYFEVTRKNLGEIDQAKSDSYIYKWRLDKKEPGEALSEPVKPIVFWIENTTPEKFRPYIKQGVLAWNEAFRAAGFLNAIEVYEQPIDADWEAGDISKNVIRWQVANHARANFGRAPAIHDPVTGEILGTDILLNYAGIGDYVDDWAHLLETESIFEDGPLGANAMQGDMQFRALTSSKISNIPSLEADVLTSGLGGAYILASIVEGSQKFNDKRVQPTVTEKIQSPMAASETAPAIQKTSVAESAGISTSSEMEELSIAERMLKEVIIQLTMHEVGHTLGLAHNFRGSRWRSMDELFDREKTKGMISASVMDYLPINFSPIGVEQGDFANTRLGPYDVWAIEFGYRPDLSETTRNDLLSRSVLPEHAFGISVFGNDPHTLLYDLTSAPIDYAKSRLEFVSQVSKLASQENTFGDQRQYLSLFLELRSQINLAVSSISGQVTPYTSTIQQVSVNGSNVFHEVGIQSQAEQKEAIRALEQLVFSTGSIPFSEEFVLRLGYNMNIVNAISLQAKSRVMWLLMSKQTLLLRHRSSEYGNEYGPTELLFDIKQAVFGSDLNPFGYPTKDRREQQIMYASYFAGLINDPATSTTERYRASDYESSFVSAAARPIRSALLRELLIPTPWAPIEVRAHRQELRAILK